MVTTLPHQRNNVSASCEENFVPNEVAGPQLT